MNKLLKQMNLFCIIIANSIILINLSSLVLASFVYIIADTRYSMLSAFTGRTKNIIISINHTYKYSMDSNLQKILCKHQ